MNRLEKSSTDRVLSGVLGGIGEYFNIDPTILRIIFVVLLICGFGSPIFLYIVMALIMPDGRKNNGRKNYGDPYYSNKNDYQKTTEKRKQAEKVEDDDWSDF